MPGHRDVPCSCRVRQDLHVAFRGQEAIDLVQDVALVLWQPFVSLVAHLLVDDELAVRLAVLDPIVEIAALAYDLPDEKTV